MSHQPFEAWLLSRDELTPQQTGELGAHLSVCSVCGSLAAALDEVEGELRCAGSVRPAPGFTRRWRARVERLEARRKDRQAWGALGLSLGTATALVAALVVSVMAAPGDWAARCLRSMVGWIADLSLAWSVIGTFLGEVPEPITIASGVGLAFGLWISLAGLAAAWFITVHRFAWPVPRGGVR